MECVTLIDISSEDDLLIPSSSQVLGSETFSNLEAENIERVSKQMEQLSELSELSESPQQKCRSGRYSLRKSLAWDSEFFTGEGVLDHEELAIYNSTYSKAIGLKLPGIHEEFRKSVESTSTLDSESRALEKLEVDLLENLRTSSKRMLVASNQTPNKELLKPDKPHPIILKKLDISSQTKVASGNGQSKSSNNPTYMSSRTPLRTVNGKCSSSVMNKKIKSNSEKAFTEITSKRQTTLALNKAKNDPAMTPRSIPSKESSLRRPQSVYKSLSASCSSSTRPAICLSDSSSSRLMILRSYSRNPICSSSSFSSRTPLKTTRSRTGSANQICHSSLGKSALLLSKLSPISSIDSFLSESSSQASTSTKHSNSLKASIGGSSSSSSIAVCALQKSGGLLPHSFTGNHSKIPSKFNSDTKGTTKLGLRMPRPRIGYFDKEKTLLHGSNNHLQTILRSSLGKSNGITDTSALNKTKPINPPLMRSGAPPSLPNHKSKSTEKTSEGNWKKSKKKFEQTNPLLELHESESQRINGGAFLLNVKQEKLQSEKENLRPELETDCQSKTVTMLEGMVSSLSLSEVNDLSFRD